MNRWVVRNEDGTWVKYEDAHAIEIERNALKAEVADRNDAMAEALEILDDYGRTNPTLPMACAELMRHHTELRIEHGKLKAEVERLLMLAYAPWAKHEPVDHDGNEYCLLCRMRAALRGEKEKP